jgi:hypothetical protein
MCPYYYTKLFNNDVKISPLQIYNFHIRNVKHMVLLTLHSSNNLDIKTSIFFYRQQLHSAYRCAYFIFSEF